MPILLENVESLDRKFGDDIVYAVFLDHAADEVRAACIHSLMIVSLHLVLQAGEDVADARLSFDYYRPSLAAHDRHVSNLRSVRHT